MKRRPSSNTNTNSIKIILSFLLLWGLGAGLASLKQSQDIRQQAKIGQQDIGVPQLGLEPAQPTNQVLTNPGKFTSAQERYRLSYDPKIWRNQAVPATANNDDQDRAFFTLRNLTGFASVYLSSQELPTNLRNYQSLHDLAKALEQTQIQSHFSNYPGQTVSYLGYDIVNIGGRNAIKFNYQTEILGHTSRYAEYVFAVGERLVEAEVKAAGKEEVTAAVSRLLQGLEFLGIKQQKQPQVLGSTSTNSAAQLVENRLTESQLVDLAHPSVLQIAHLYCKQLQVDTTGATYLQNSYPYCNVAAGSGFIVGSDGLVATNGHVVESYPEQDVIGGLFTGNIATYEFLADTVQQVLSEEGLLLTKAESQTVLDEMIQDPNAVDSLVIAMYDLFEEGVARVEDRENIVYVNASQRPFQINEEIEELTQDNVRQLITLDNTTFKAHIQATDFANHLKKEVILEEKKPEGSDVALIKIVNQQGYHFPVLPLALDSEIKSGRNILVMGYPGLVSGGDSELFLDYQASAGQPTITRGIVSAVKADKAGNRLIQTDASIEQGNSGGPALNLNGEVIGIATYAFNSDSGNYNFLRDVVDLVDLSEQANINLGNQDLSTYLAWRQGLDYFWQDRYSRSLEQLAAVEDSYPIHPTVELYVADANQAIKAGRDVDLVFGIEKEYVYGGLVGLGVVLVGLVIWLAARAIKGSKQQYPHATPSV